MACDRCNKRCWLNGPPHLVFCKHCVYYYGKYCGRCKDLIERHSGCISGRYKKGWDRFDDDSNLIWSISALMDAFGKESPRRYLVNQLPFGVDGMYVSMSELYRWNKN